MDVQDFQTSGEQGVSGFLSVCPGLQIAAKSEDLPLHSRHSAVMSEQCGDAICNAEEIVAKELLEEVPSLLQLSHQHAPSMELEPGDLIAHYFDSHGDHQSEQVQSTTRTGANQSTERTMRTPPCAHAECNFDSYGREAVAF